MCGCRCRQRTRTERAVLCAAVLLSASCFADRARPTPVAPVMPVRLSVQLLAPRSGLTLGSGDTVRVRVQARDLEGQGLHGLGYVARRFGPGLPMLDSAAIRFAARADSVHEFVFRMPNLPTNTQIDVYGIAFGTGALHRLSPPHYLIAVCTSVPCR